MEKSTFKNESWDEFNYSVTKEELNFDLELLEYERLDIEAQNIAPVFHVR